MATDFFQQQDHARRSTTRLVVLFGLAVLALIASIELLLAATMGYFARHPDTGAIDWTAVTNPQLLVVSVVGTLLVVGGGSLYKMAELRAGGRLVAEQLGGRLLTPGSGDPVEQRLQNIVEEMAIASGTPTPPVYLLDQEEGINAFAAGFSPDDAVIGVTRGGATRLDRDELQGVIAHEFSHILNGDMRLNLRLMGLLHGILIIGMLGYFILRVSSFGGGGRRSKGGKDALPILALGAGLAAIGFTGTFFGNMIKAAVSRQREFLADASAVQFTRQPDGIAGALKKIGSVAAGSSIANPNAPEASHMFFGRATSGFSAMFATHPPLAERIRRIDPSWNGEFVEQGPQDASGMAPAVAAAGAAGFAGGGTSAEWSASGFPGGASGGSSSVSRSPAPGGELARAVASVGRPDHAHLAYAGRLIGSLPPALVAAAREPLGACAVVHGLLLDRDPAIREHQLSHLESAADRGLHEETRRLIPFTATLAARMRLPLLEIALPALRSLSAAQRDAFTRDVAALVRADSKVDLFEWSLHRILLRDLSANGARRVAIRYRTVAELQGPWEQLLSTLAYAGQRDVAAAAQAFEQARVVLDQADARLLPRESCSLTALGEALGALDQAAPQVKRQVLEAAVACVAADRDVTSAEAELLRAVSASMSCPMPPILID